ncbi:MAG: hypothetical protein HUU29_02515 [Planctomycetaceae bacterium]|nr:hypothetical protein [Planctomycetaceae bacterium]
MKNFQNEFQESTHDVAAKVQPAADSHQGGHQLQPKPKSVTKIRFQKSKLDRGSTTLADVDKEVEHLAALLNWSKLRIGRCLLRGKAAAKREKVPVGKWLAEACAKLDIKLPTAYRYMKVAKDPINATMPDDFDPKYGKVVLGPSFSKSRKQPTKNENGSEQSEGTLSRDVENPSPLFTSSIPETILSANSQIEEIETARQAKGMQNGGPIRLEHIVYELNNLAMALLEVSQFEKYLAETPGADRAEKLKFVIQQTEEISSISCQISSQMDGHLLELSGNSKGK